MRDTIFGLIPFFIMTVAYVCLRSWKRMCGSDNLRCTLLKRLFSELLEIRLPFRLRNPTAGAALPSSHARKKHRKMPISQAGFLLSEDSPLTVPGSLMASPP